MKRKLFLASLIFGLVFLVGCKSKSNNTNATILPGGSKERLGTPDPVENPVVIADVLHDTNGLETIVITNVSQQKQDIHGYSLILTSTSEHINILNVTLEPGASYKVYNGPTAKEQKDGLVWLDHAVLVESGNDITLLNRAGRVIWTYVYYP